MAGDVIRETVYEHAEGRDYFTVTACERRSIGEVRRLAEKFPGEVEIVYENEDGSLLAHMPYSWMRIVPRRRVTMSEEQKAAASERLRKAREERSENG